MVESAFDERVVGVPDPEDDCLVIWDLIKANEPPKQIVEGGEYFVLKTDKAPAWTEIPESAPPSQGSIGQVHSMKGLHAFLCGQTPITPSNSPCFAGFKGRAHH